MASMGKLVMTSNSAKTGKADVPETVRVAPDACTLALSELSTVH